MICLLWILPTVPCDQTDRVEKVDACREEGQHNHVNLYLGGTLLRHLQLMS